MHKTVRNENAEIVYQVRGTGPPLVLIMGFGADGNTWEKHLQVYERHFRCLIIDNRGVGRSSQPPGPYSTKLMAGDAAAVMSDAGVDKAQVAGISMGGAIAQELALGYPGRVQSLVLISTWPRFDNYTKTVYQNLKNLRVTSTPNDFTQLLQLWIFASPYYEGHQQELDQAEEAAAQNPYPQSRAGFEGQLDACIAHNTVDRLNEIKVPTLITVGERDIFTPPEFSIELHRRIAGSQLVTFPDGGHAHHWEDLQRFNQLTSDFLQKNR